MEVAQRFEIDLQREQRASQVWDLRRIVASMEVEEEEEKEEE